MKTLYLECNMGAAGDMLLAALLELVPDQAAALAGLNALGIPGVRYEATPSTKCGILGTHLSVTVDGQKEESHEVGYEHDHHHEEHDHCHEAHEHGHDPIPHHTGESQTPTHSHFHTGMVEIEQIAEILQCSDTVRQRLLSVYHLIAQAESEAHGCPVSQIHFHEVGSLDAVADIAGVCLLIEQLAPERILASPITTGFGQIRCAHGILPVPAPATAFLLRGIPIKAGSVQGELCTPTGAALLRCFADEFCEMPTMTVEEIGYGMGTKDFPSANCLRAMLGETKNTAAEICELCCNLDDMTGEAISFAEQRLLDAGALDVFLTPIQMKKSRPAVLLTCLCHKEERERFSLLILKHTTSLGVRESVCRRTILNRSAVCVDTPYGKIGIKCAEGFGIHRQKAEYEDVATAATACDAAFDTVSLAALTAYEEQL